MKNTSEKETNTAAAPSKHICIGMVAHVDSGKTTLSEGILYKSGTTRSLGRVDHGDAFLDTYSLEKDRGITIFSKQAVLTLGDKTVTLLDTPGHMDFSAEMERTLQVLDYAVLIISGPDGTAGQVMTLWHLLDLYRVPTFIFINKMDQPGADISAVMADIEKNLSRQCALAGSDDFYEKSALCEEGLLDDYLESGKVEDEALRRLIAQRKIFPCFAGSALKMEGVSELLSGLQQYTQPPFYPADFGARIYKISRDSQGNRLTHMKITGGSLTVRQQLAEGKVNQIRIYSGQKFEAAQQAEAGCICAVTGLEDTFCGQGLGIEPAGKPPYLDTVLTCQVLLPDGWDSHDAYLKFSQLSEELPELHVVWDEAASQLRVQMMGEIQGEILKSLAQERFGKEIDFGAETVLYKETIAEKTEGVGHFEPLRHYAEAHVVIEPLPSGSGVLYDTACSEDDLDRNWQHLILTHLAERQHPGVLTGSPLTDVKFTLVAGRGHLKHTEGGDFRQAAYRAVRHGLRKGGGVLLEPYYVYRLELPADMVGRAMTDIQKMEGTCDPAESTAERAVLTGQAPVSAMNGYHKDVISYTKGRGRLYCTLKGYFPCRNTEEVVKAIGYDPDRDVDNPCGSVFCSHGAGVNVPWNEVEQHMHLPLTLKTEKQEARGSAQVPSHRRSYSDEELEAVFRKTYGIAGRESGRFRKSPRIISAGNYAGPKVKSGYNNAAAEAVLLIDGYNMIFAWDELKEMSKLNLESARNLLIETLCNYQGYRGENIIVVFDAYKQPGNIGMSEMINDVKVVYTKEGETADQYIEKYVLEHVNKMKITVATSDGLEQMMIFGQGALRMSARELRQRILDTNAEIRERYLQK